MADDTKPLPFLPFAPRRATIAALELTPEMRARDDLPAIARAPEAKLGDFLVQYPQNDGPIVVSRAEFLAAHECVGGIGTAVDVKPEPGIPSIGYVTREELTELAKFLNGRIEAIEEHQRKAAAELSGAIGVSAEASE